ncbi:MAG: DUF262 domain-containing protein [Sphingobacteriaceae bacterium]|nr:DUF262 domain-containing protein [Sphingobacteriaceae bacterium]
MGGRKVLEVLKENPNIISIPLSLMGFSIECLLKALIVRDNPSFIANGILARKLRSHDLIKLAKTAKVNLSRDEEVFCTQAIRAMTIDSRYPTGLSASDEQTSMDFGGNARKWCSYNFMIKYILKLDRLEATNSYKLFLKLTILFSFKSSFMNFNKRTIKGLFDTSQKTFIVPVYQRAYSWEKEQWKALLDDLKEQMQGNNNYFFGNILMETIQEDVEYEIIDGQQRLTTLLIFIRSLLEVFKDRKIGG